MDELFKLYGTVKVDVQEVVSGLKHVKETADKTGESLTGNGGLVAKAKDAGKEMQDIGQKIATGVGGALVGSDGLVSKAKEAGKEMEEIGKKMTHDIVGPMTEIGNAGNPIKIDTSEAVAHVEELGAELDQIDDEINMDASGAVSSVKALKEEVKETTNAVGGKNGLTEEVKRAERDWKQIGKNMQKSGAILSAGVTLPLTMMAKKSIDVGMTFEAQMNRVNAISGATAEEFKKLEQQALDLGQSSVFGSSDVGEGMEMMASAGLEVIDIMKAVPGVMDLAAVSGRDMGLASEAVATAVNQFKLDADESTHVADIFAEAAAKTNAETNDMAEALKYAGPVAGSLNLALEETAAVIGIMSNSGIKGSQAGTVLRSSLLALGNPTKDAAKVMESLGVSVFDASGVMLPMADVIGQLQDGMNGLTEEQKQQALSTLFGQQAVSGMLALVNTAPGEIDAMTESLINSDGAAKRMADTMNSGLPGSIADMNSSLETARIHMKDALAPVLTLIANLVAGVADWFSGLNPIAQTTIAVVLGLVGAIGPLILVIGNLIAFGLTPLGIAGWAAIAPFLLFFGKVAAGVALIWGLYEALKAIVDVGKNLTGKFFGIDWDKDEDFDDLGDDGDTPKRKIKTGKGLADVAWNAQGGVFKKPTIFNTHAGKQGVGEAGAEAIIPLRPDVLAGIGAGVGDSVSFGRMEALLAEQLKEIAGLRGEIGKMKVQLDGRTVGKIMTPYVNTNLGQEQVFANSRF